MDLLDIAEDDATFAPQRLYDVIATHFRYVVVDDEAQWRHVVALRLNQFL